MPPGVASKKPLTPLMLATVEHLASRGDRALVRHLSDHWIAESDAGRDAVLREVRDLDDRLRATGMAMLTDAPPLVIVRTSTVNAMAARGLLKMVGPKRIIRAAVARKDYARAELTPHATALRASMEDRAEAAYRGLLAGLR